MKVGLIGLGKMGFNLALNLLDHGHEVIGYDVNKNTRDGLTKQGVKTVSSIEEVLLCSNDGRRIIWLMLPSGAPSEDTVQLLKEKMKEGDILIDAGNSNYKDSIRRAQDIQKKGILYLDVGTSGGMLGARQGACLMIGGPIEAYTYMEPVFQAISIQNGCIYAGESGAGHFMKMVHNGIEYGMMQAIGEGFQLMKESPFNYNLQAVANNWNHGSVIRGWLMEIMEDKFSDQPYLENYRGVVDASGEAKWTVETALEMEVPVPVIALSLMMRNRSKEEDSFAAKVVAAMRNGFGGHTYVCK